MCIITDEVLLVMCLKKWNCSLGRRDSWRCKVLLQVSVDAALCVCVCACVKTCRHMTVVMYFKFFSFERDASSTSSSTFSAMKRCWNAPTLDLAGSRLLATAEQRYQSVHTLPHTNTSEGNYSMAAKTRLLFFSSFSLSEFWTQVHHLLCWWLYVKSYRSLT